MTEGGSAVDFGITPEQAALQEQARQFVQRQRPLETVRRLEREGEAFSAPLYEEMGRYGYLGVGLQDGDRLARLLVCEELGRGLLWTPMFDSAVLVAEVLRLTGQEGDRVERLLGGTELYAFAHPSVDQPVPAFHRPGGGYRITPCMVRSPWLGRADRVGVVVSLATGPRAGETALALLRREDWLVAPGGRLLDVLPTFEAVLRADAAAGEEDLVLGARLPHGLRLAQARALAGLAAFCLGAARQSLDIAVSYAKQRHQFGRPIGSFQAQQHKLANVLLAVTQAEKVVQSTAAVSEDREPYQSAMAFRRAASALSQAAMTGSLVHGGYGFTVEQDIQLYFRRAKILDLLYRPLVAERLVGELLAEPRECLPLWR